MYPTNLEGAWQKQRKKINWTPDLLYCRNVCDTLFNKYFGIQLDYYQLDVGAFVIHPDYRKISVRAPSRIGKSYLLAGLETIIPVLDRGASVGNIAPTESKASIIPNYIYSFLSKSKDMRTYIDVDRIGLDKIDKLGQSVSKQKITFKKEFGRGYIQPKSADVKGKGEGIMGWGWKYNFIDETSLIDEVSYSKVYRGYIEVKGESKIIEIGNPWNLDHFYDNQNSEDWTKIHIDWRDGVIAGRFSYEDIMDLKKKYTELEFTVLCEANFPDNIDKALFKQKEHLDKAIIFNEPPEYEKILIGIDVARGGIDNSVIVVLGEYAGKVYFIEYLKIDTRDTMQLVGEIREFIDKYDMAICEIKVDTVGVGGGTYDRLKELSYPAHEFIAGQKANDSRYSNYKTETAVGLSKCMGDNRFHNLPDGTPLITDLKKYTIEVANSERAIKLVDPKDKSPDYGDALIIAYSQPYNKITFLDGFDI